MHNDKKLLRGQAVLELAVFGILIIMAFSTVLIYGQRLDFTQHLKMESFRKGLHASYSRNAPVSYTLKKNSRIANLFTDFGQGQLISPTAVSSVMWQKGLAGNQDETGDKSVAYYQLNDYVLELPKAEKEVTDAMGDTKMVPVTASVYKEEVVVKSNYCSTASKTDDTNSINNARSSELGETIGTKVYVRYDVTPTDESSEMVYTGPHDFDYVPVPYSVASQGANIRDEDSIEYVQVVGTTDSKGDDKGIVIRDEGRIGYTQNEAGSISKGRSWDTPNYP